MPDEPRAPEYPHILKLAENIHSNPGPGRALPIFVTSAYVDALDRVDRHLVLRVRRASRSIASRRSARAAGSTGSTTAAGRPAARSRSMRPRPMRARRSGPRSSTTSRVYFYWHAVHWRHNSQKQGERDQNVWAESITFDNRGQPNKPIDDQGYIHGDGVLIYPGEEQAAPGRGSRHRPVRSPPSSSRISGAACRTTST